MLGVSRFSETGMIGKMGMVNEMRMVKWEWWNKKHRIDFFFAHCGISNTSEPIGYAALVVKFILARSLQK